MGVSRGDFNPPHRAWQDLLCNVNRQKRLVLTRWQRHREHLPSYGLSSVARQRTLRAFLRASRLADHSRTSVRPPEDG